MKAPADAWNNLQVIDSEYSAEIIEVPEGGTFPPPSISQSTPKINSSSLESCRHAMTHYFEMSTHFTVNLFEF